MILLRHNKFRDVKFSLPQKRKAGTLVPAFLDEKFDAIRCTSNVNRVQLLNIKFLAEKNLFFLILLFCIGGQFNKNRPTLE